MEFFMRWVCSVAAASTLCIGMLWANTEAESRVSLLECKMKAAHDEMVYPCRAGARFASGRPFLNSYGLWAVGNVLYWTAYEGGTEIAYRGASTGGGLEVPVSLKSVSFDWQVGYRIGAGWVTPHENMEFAVLFTRIEPNGDASMKISSPDNVNGIILPEIAEADRMSTKWDVKYSVLDVEFGRAYFLSRYFYMRPYFGSRSAWILQWANLSFTGPSMDPILAHLRNGFIGSGLRMGSDSKWFFARHWNLFLGGSVSALYGKFTVDTGSVQDLTYGLDAASSNYRIAPAAQAQIGLGWETNFSCESNQLAINLGYELNYWWRQNQLPALEALPETSSAAQIYGARQSKDLAFHGLTVDIQLAF